MKQRLALYTFSVALTAILLGSAFKHSKAKHSKAKAGLHCLLDCAIVASVPTLDNECGDSHLQKRMIHRYIVNKVDGYFHTPIPNTEN